MAVLHSCNVYNLIQIYLCKVSANSSLGCLTNEITNNFTSCRRKTERTRSTKPSILLWTADLRCIVFRFAHISVTSGNYVQIKFIAFLNAFYQDGIETVDAAYAVFLRIWFEDFQQYAFELQTCAAKNLNPQRVKEYLGIIHQHQGLTACQVHHE